MNINSAGGSHQDLKGIRGGFAFNMYVLRSCLVVFDKKCCVSVLELEIFAVEVRKSLVD